MADVFISYAREDRDQAERLAAELADEGLICWWDQHLKAGSRFSDRIEAELRGAQAVVVMWSAHAVASHWVIDEACVGRDNGRLAPISLDGAAPPLGFRQFQVIDFSGWLSGDKGPIRSLIAAIQELSPVAAPARRGVSASSPERVLERPAVAVLPFENLSGDPSQEYFADGVTADLITALSAWRWFPVIARNSTFVYKHRPTPVTQIGKELRARYVVEGSVRRAGARVRISAQLVEAASGHHLWAQSYDREIEDVFALQDEITRSLIGALEPRISLAEQQRAMRKTPENLDAWDVSLQAAAEIRRGTVQSLQRAEKMLVKAVEMDRTSSYAQSLLALTCFQGALFGWLNDPAGSLVSTYAAAEEAVALDDADWLAHALLGLATLWTRGAYDRAAAEVETAIALNPSAAMAYHFSGCVRTFNGQPAAALPHLMAVLKLDPRFQLLPTTLADIALAHFLLGELDQAVLFCERALAEQRDHPRAWQRLAASLAAQGRLDEAAAAFAEVMRLQPEFGRPYLKATYPFRNPAHTAMLEDGIKAAGWSG